MIIIIIIMIIIINFIMLSFTDLRRFSVLFIQVGNVALFGWFQDTGKERHMSVSNKNLSFAAYLVVQSTKSKMADLLCFYGKKRMIMRRYLGLIITLLTSPSDSGFI